MKLKLTPYKLRSTNRKEPIKVPSAGTTVAHQPHRQPPTITP